MTNSSPQLPSRFGNVWRRTMVVAGFVVLAILAVGCGENEPEPLVPEVPFIPTPEAVVEKMLELAEVTDQDVVYDLGCGDGRILIAAAKRGAKAHGIDIDPARVKESRENIRRAGLEHLATVEEADIFDVDLSPATVITMYLLPSVNRRLIPQFEKMAPGSRIVSHGFDMGPDYPEEKVGVARGWLPEHPVRMWRTPLVKAKTEPEAPSDTQ